MPLYGDVLYGSALYGSDVPGDSIIALWRQVYGGSAPWLPQDGPPYRSRTWQLLQPDNTPIVGLVEGSELRVAADGLLFPQWSANLVVADPTGRYLEGGADAALLAVAATCRIRCTVTTLAGTLYWQTPLLRIREGWSRAVDRWGRETITTTAEDWLRAQLTSNVLTDAQTPAATALSYALSDVSHADYLPNPTVRDLLQGVYSVFAGGSAWLMDGTPPDTCDLSESLQGGPVLNYQIPTSPVYVDPSAGAGADYTWHQLLDALQTQWGFRVQYGASGVPFLSSSAARWKSGYVISGDAAVGGSYPAPWERVERAIGRPAFTRVEVWAQSGGGGAISDALLVNWRGVAPAEHDRIRLTTAAFTDDGEFTQDDVFEANTGETLVGPSYVDGTYVAVIPLPAIPEALRGAGTLALRYWQGGVGFIGPTLLLSVADQPGTTGLIEATADGLTLVAATGQLGIGGTPGLWRMVDSATSTNPLFPHVAPYAKTEIVQDVASAQWRLWGYLGEADRLSVTVDSACELPPLGSDVRVAVPQYETNIDGWYEFTEATVPIGLNAARWDLKWKAPA